MTDIVPVPEVVLASEFPTLADRVAGEWNRKAKEWADSENAMALSTREIALTAHNNATAAKEQAQAADSARAAAQAAAADAQAAADAAAATAGATKWDAGEMYSEGAVVWSPISLQSYRRRVAGSGGDDPSEDRDGIVWVPISDGGGAGVTLNGNTTVYTALPTIYTITNYNSFSVYEVVVSAGSVSRSGDTITFVPPDEPQDVVLTVAVDGRATEFDITVIDVPADIIGVVLLEPGGNGGTWAHIDANGNIIPAPDSGYFNSHSVWGGMQDVVIDGQQMVKIPAFYVRRAEITIVPYVEPLSAWWIADAPAVGFHRHPAFMDGGNEIDQIYIGKYQASMEGGKLASKPGVLPTVSRSLTQFIADAQARNVGGVSGFMLWSVYQWSAIQWLYLVENATMDSQTKTGQGRVNASSAANVDASDVAQATYRGIVGLWGNVRQWMDGLKTNASGIHLWDRLGNKTWVSTGKNRTAANGTIYPNTFMAQTGANYNFGDVFIGDTGPTTNENATAPDQQYFGIDTTERFPYVGGYWGDAAEVGLWFVNCYYAASESNSFIGSRLAKV